MSSPSSTLSPLTRHLLDLFQGPLRDVRFPDADGDRLGAAVDAAVAAGEAVVRAEAALEIARGALLDQQRVVAQETDRALAYARVYAADRPDVRAALEAVTSRPATAKRGPGRPRKITAPPAIAQEAAAAAE